MKVLSSFLIPPKEMILRKVQGINASGRFCLYRFCCILSQIAPFYELIEHVDLAAFFVFLNGHVGVHG